MNGYHSNSRPLWSALVTFLVAVAKGMTKATVHYGREGMMRRMTWRLVRLCCLVTLCPQSGGRVGWRVRRGKGRGGREGGSGAWLAPLPTLTLVLGSGSLSRDGPPQLNIYGNTS